MLAATRTKTQAKTVSNNRKKPTYQTVFNDEGDLIRVENVLSARGILFSGNVVKISEYSNIILLSDDEDNFIHVVYRGNIGLELTTPNIKRDKEGNKHQEGGFVQPLTPPASKDPIVQSRHTNPL